MFFQDHPIRNINNPLAYRHIKIIKNIIKLAALWPELQSEDEGSKSKKLLLYLIYVFYWISIYLNFLYLYRNFKVLSFFDMGLMYLTIFLISTSLSRCMTIPLNAGYCRIMKKFLLEFHIFYFRNESVYASKINAKVHTVSHILTMYYVGVTILGITLFNFTSVYTNYNKGLFSENTGNFTFVLSLYFAYPWDATSNVKGYVAATLYNWLVSFICGIYLIIMDLLISLMVLQVWGHIKILLNKLDTFPKPANETEHDRETSKLHYFSETEKNIIQKELKSIINYHRMIIEFTDEMSNVFGLTLFIFYAFHQISGCLLLLEVSPMTFEAVLNYGFLTATEFQLLIQLSIIFESIGIVSEKIKDKVYNLPWECMDNKCKNIVLIFLNKVQDPIHLKALSFTEVGVTTMATILKTSFSYFLFLRTMK